MHTPYLICVKMPWHSFGKMLTPNVLNHIIAQPYNAVVPIYTVWV